MKNKLLLICLLLLNLSIAKAQEISFVVDKNREEVIKLVGKLQSSLSKGPFDALKDDRLFSTTISIKNEIYPAVNHKNYLVVKYKNKPSKAKISSTWYISVEKISPTKTKVTSNLVIVTASEGKKNVDSEETFSSGKLEKQLKDSVEKNSNDHLEEKRIGNVALGHESPML
ncbi:hypothetical protein QFZ20_002983 [Flavobacterium sp. W4I14]|nr:hypothetical protein [Flavobacterium sp. W4I14]